MAQQEHSKDALILQAEEVARAARVALAARAPTQLVVNPPGLLCAARVHPCQRTDSAL